MTEETGSIGKSQAKREKLTSFANWPVWSGITESMLIEKEFWDLVSTGSCLKRQNPMLWAKEIKEDRMAVGIALQIITEGVSDQIALNIMDLKDLKEMWDKLKSISTEVGQGIAYLILQKLFYYTKINKAKGIRKASDADICRSTIPLQMSQGGDNPWS